MTQETSESTQTPAVREKHGRGVRPNPWMWLAGVMAVVIVAMSFALGYMVADRNQPQETTQQEQQVAKPTAEDVKKLKNAMQSVSERPSIVDKQGLIVVSKDGYGKTIKGVPTVTVFEEPLCPFCGQLNRALDPTLSKLVAAGQINLRIGLVNFLNQASSDSYSNRAVNGALVIAENDGDPNHLMGYLSNLYAEDFMPSEGQDYKSVSDAVLKERAMAAGVSQEVADKAFDGQNKYVQWVDAMTSYTTSRTELWGEGQQGFSTPTMLVNDRFLDLSSMMSDTSKAGDVFLSVIGLDPDDAGNSSVKPSIGAKGKPIA